MSGLARIRGRLARIPGRLGRVPGRVARILPGRRPRPNRLFLAAFALFFGLGACWSLATPMFAAPDETSHLVKAAATVRGEITGTKGYVTEWGIEQPMRTYRVPAAYGVDVFPCYAFHVTVTPACELSNRHDRRLLSSGGSVSMWTTAGHYNPIYYALIGWPSLLFRGVGGMYLIRLASAAINALILACAAALAARLRRPGALVAGLMTAVTPTVLFLGGVVNPNGVEASAAILAWVAAVSLALQPDPRLLRTRVRALMFAIAVLANARPLGYEWIAAILLTAGWLAGRRGVREIVGARSRGTWRAATWLAAAWRAAAWAAPALLFGLWWTLTHGDDAKAAHGPEDAFLPAAHLTLDRMQDHIGSMVALFGWVDTPAPAVTYDLWFGAVILLTVPAIALARRGQSAALCALALGIVVIPLVAQGIEARHIGIAWQGRYLLAFAVGLPVLAGAVLSARAEQVRPPGSGAERRMVLTLTALLAFADFAGFFHALRRNMVGLNGRLLLEPISWQPPGTWLLWVPLYALLLALSVAFAARLARGPEGAPSGQAASVRLIGPRLGPQLGPRLGPRRSRSASSAL